MTDSGLTADWNEQRPPTLEEAGDWLAKRDEGVYTFSNGTHYEGWAHRNCWACQFYDHEGDAGALCAFEAAAMLGLVSPELARLFGWIEDEKEPDKRQAFDVPAECAFFRSREDPPLPFNDPDQIVLELASRAGGAE